MSAAWPPARGVRGMHPVLVLAAFAFSLPLPFASTWARAGDLSEDAPRRESLHRGLITSLALRGEWIFAASQGGVFAHRGERCVQLPVCGDDEELVRSAADAIPRDETTGDTSGRPIALATFDGEGGPRLLVAGGRPARAGRLWLYALEGADASASDAESPPGARRIATRRVARDLLYALAVARDGRRALTGGDDGEVVLLDPQDLSSRAVLRAHARAVRAVAFSPDGERAASAGADGLVIITRIPAEPEAQTEEDLARGRGESVEVARDKETSEDAAATALRLASEHVLAEHTAPVECLAFAPESDRLASGARDGRVRIHQVETGRFTRAYHPLGAAVWALAFTPSGERLFAGLADGTLVELSLDASGEEIRRRRLDAPIRALLSKPAPDGRVQWWTADREGPSRLE